MNYSLTFGKKSSLRLFSLALMLLLAFTSCKDNQPMGEKSAHGERFYSKDSEITANFGLPIAGQFTTMGAAPTSSGVDYGSIMGLVVSEKDLAPIRAKYPDYRRCVSAAKDKIMSLMRPMVFVATAPSVNETLLSIAKKSQEARGWVTFKIRGRRLLVKEYKYQGSTFSLPDGLGDHIFVEEAEFLSTD